MKPKTFRIIIDVTVDIAPGTESQIVANLEQLAFNAMDSGAVTEGADESIVEAYESHVKTLRRKTA